MTIRGTMPEHIGWSENGVLRCAACKARVDVGSMTSPKHAYTSFVRGHQDCMRRSANKVVATLSLRDHIATELFCRNVSLMYNDSRTKATARNAIRAASIFCSALDGGDDPDDVEALIELMDADVVEMSPLLRVVTTAA